MKRSIGPIVGFAWAGDTERGEFLLKMLLIALFFLAYLLSIGFANLVIPDEVRYAEIAREMLKTGNWIVPKLNGLLYFEKPPMGHWLNAIAQWIFGENPFSVRITSTVSAGLMAWILYRFSEQMLLKKSTALAIPFIYLTTLEVFGVGTFSVLDSMFSTILNIGIIVFYLAATSINTKRQALLFIVSGFFLGCAFLTKGFLAVVIPGLVLGIWLLWQKKFKAIFVSTPTVVIAILLVVAPWAWLIHMSEPDFWRYFIWVEHVQRFMAENAQHKQPMIYLLVVLPLVAFPWISLLPAALLGIKRSGEKIGESPFLSFVMLWMIVPFVFFSISSGKLLTYILPCFAPFAIIVALGIERYLQQENTHAISIGLVANSILISLFAIVLIGVQLFSSEQILFGDNELYKLVVLAGILFLVAATLLYFVRSKSVRASLYANGLISLVALSCVSVLMPIKVLHSKTPAPLLETYSTDIGDNSIVISHGSLIRAVSWYLKRDDVYLHNNMGELSYGIEADGNRRFIDDNSIGVFIQQSRESGSILIICKRECGTEILTVLPSSVDRRSYGNFVGYLVEQ